jgi:hypothetical protein
MFGGQLVALDNKGGTLWAIPNGGFTPVIGNSGEIYVGSSKVDQSQRVPSIVPQRAVEAYNRLVVDQNGYQVFSGWQGFQVMNPQGKYLWRYPVQKGGDYRDSRARYSAPTVGRDGSIYLAAAEDYTDTTKKGTLISFNRAGEQNWTVPLSWSGNSPMLLSDDSVVADGGGYGGAIYVYSRTGALRWFMSGASNGGKLLAVGPGDIIYVHRVEDYSGYLYALFPDGRIKWRIRFEAGPADRAAVDAEGTLYAVGGGRLYAIDAAGRILWDQGEGFFNVIIGTNRTIYALGLAGLYAISDEGNEWPQGANTNIILDSYAPTQIVLSATDADDCELKFEVLQVLRGIIQKIGAAPCTPGNPNQDALVIDFLPAVGSNQAEIAFWVTDAMGVRSKAARHTIYFKIK